MYVAYALSVAISVAAFLSTYLLFPETPYWAYIIIVLLSLVGMAPITFRGARLIWINFFSSYKSDAIDKFKKQNNE
jgi:accessory gene regulator protein AgrB